MDARDDGFANWTRSAVRGCRHLSAFCFKRIDVRLGGGRVGACSSLKSIRKRKGKQKSKNLRPVKFSVIAVVHNKLALQKHVCIEIVDFMKHIPVHLFLMSGPRKSCRTILRIAQHPLSCVLYSASAGPSVKRSRRSCLQLKIICGGRHCPAAFTQTFTVIWSCDLFCCCEGLEPFFATTRHSRVSGLNGFSSAFQIVVAEMPYSSTVEANFSKKSFRMPGSPSLHVCAPGLWVLSRLLLGGVA